MPFAGYKDFAACVAANKDKGNPQAYCATIERKISKKHNYSSKAIEEARKRA